MPRTASPTAKPALVARRAARRRAKEGASRTTGRPPKKVETAVFRVPIPFPPKRPNYRKLLEASIEREREWKRQLMVSDCRAHKLEEVCAAQAQNLIVAGDTIALLTAQGYHVKGLYAALLQRYVGAKLDTQHFNLSQAQAFVDRETAALEAGLEQLNRNQERATGDCDAQVQAEFAEVE